MIDKKPSERVIELCNKRHGIRPDATIFDSRALSMRDVLDYLDEEHERRAKFERGVLQRLEILERSQRDVLTRLPVMDHSALTGLPAGDTPSPSTEEWLASIALRCSERMPKPKQRVLAFVPSQPEGRRWRVAQWCAPPAQYTDASWRDEESMVGDEAYRWQPDQVTHWMPMPGEPA